MTGEGAGNYINVRIPSICVLILSKADRDTTINARDVKDGTYRFGESRTTWIGSPQASKRVTRQHQHERSCRPVSRGSRPRPRHPNCHAASLEHLAIGEPRAVSTPPVRRVYSFSVHDTYRPSGSTATPARHQLLPASLQCSVLHASILTLLLFAAHPGYQQLSASISSASCAVRVFMLDGCHRLNNNGPHCRPQKQ